MLRPLDHLRFHLVLLVTFTAVPLSKHVILSLSMFVVTVSFAIIFRALCLVDHMMIRMVMIVRFSMEICIALTQ